MVDAANPTSTLLTLTTEAIVPLINGCARVVGRKDSLRFKRAIDYFGPPIAAKWRDWSRNQKLEEVQAELQRLVSLSEEDARRAVTASLTRFATASPPDQEAAIDYLAAIPANAARYVGGHGTLAAPLPWPLDRESDFLGFLPIYVPPFSPGSALAKTPYRLESLLGGGEFGVVYRVANSSDPAQRRVIKFCLDNAFVGSLAHEREHLNRLLTLGLARWSPGIARLFNYNLDVPIPYLVYEFCQGMNLSSEVRHVRQETGAGFSAEKTLELVTQIAAALAFAHSRGLVYGDLKPSNVIIQKSETRNPKSEPDTGEKILEIGFRVSEIQVKLTDFGTTAVSAGLVAQTCPVSSREGAPLVSAATHVRLLHGSNTSMYMCGEFRRGDQPQPHHDIYSLGVLWYQILMGDVTREIHPGWADELISECRTPKKHVQIMQSCLGYYKRRPVSAADLLPVLQSLAQLEGDRPRVTFVSERLRKLDERFARAGRASADSTAAATEVVPQTEDAPETLWGQETRVLKGGMLSPRAKTGEDFQARSAAESMARGLIPLPGATPAQINRDAERTRLMQLLNDQLAKQSFEEARETLDVLLHLYPHDPEVLQVQTLLGQKR
jgi:serine/threonine protein kinase